MENSWQGNEIAMVIAMLNFLFVLFTLSVERKNSSQALSWILLLIFLPVIGFVLYILFGTNIFVRKRRMFNNKYKLDNGYVLRKDEKIKAKLKNNHFVLFGDCISLDNKVELFFSAKEKYRQLIIDIENAEKSINLLYFIIHNDAIGRLIVDLLVRKAKNGVMVRVLYDHAGCIFTSPALFKELKKSGALVERFFPLSYGNYLRLNFRNHRKVAVIDDKIAYLGGMNIGDEYMGLDKHITPWRDTHLRITGHCVADIKLRFLKDWQFATEYRDKEILRELEQLCNSSGTNRETDNDCPMQIISSGPDTGENEIKWTFLKYIYQAENSIRIETPYFVPDESFIEALKIAALSGKKVQIIAPGKSDNLAVQLVSRAYLGELLSYGVEVYFYNGFMHAKMLLVDEQVVSIGSANMDMRSFSLNFEINAFIYSTAAAESCSRVFQQDMNNAERYTIDKYIARSFITRLLEGLFRLLAPLM